MKPVTNYAQWMLTRQAERYTAAVEAMPEEALTWRPADATTNSVAQLVRHVHEGLPWLLGFATGDTEPITDRAVQHQRHLHSLRNDPATKEELLGIIQTAMTKKDDLLAKVDELDLSEEINPMGTPRQRFFFVGLVVDHGAEHLGHAELTRQLWEQRDQQR
ncbi:MAG: mycothiol transferase [Thermomicrobiales bacterium]